MKYIFVKKKLYCYWERIFIENARRVPIITIKYYLI